MDELLLLATPLTLAEAWTGRRFADHLVERRIAGTKDLGKA